VSNFEEAERFWKTVAEPAKWEDLRVGQAVLLEDHLLGKGSQRVVIITDNGINSDGKHLVRFRDAAPDDEIPEDEVMTVLVAG